jgi:hypothetical protein
MPLDLYWTLQLCLVIANSLQVLGGSQGQFRKNNQNATTVSYKSYNLMHNPKLKA